MTFKTRVREVGEDSGSYAVVDRNRVALTYWLKTTDGKDLPSTANFDLTVIQDTLFSTNPFRAGFYTRVHPDSFPCGLKPWTLFQKPSGWDSLIKPY